MLEMIEEKGCTEDQSQKDSCEPMTVVLHVHRVGLLLWISWNLLRWQIVNRQLEFIIKTGIGPAGKLGLAGWLFVLAGHHEHFISIGHLDIQFRDRPHFPVIWNGCWIILVAFEFLQVLLLWHIVFRNELVEDPDPVLLHLALLGLQIFQIQQSIFQLSVDLRAVWRCHFLATQLSYLSLLLGLPCRNGFQ